MRFDFWNNPLVVTAMRLKYRRGSPGVWAVLWVLALLAVGALVHHLSQENGFRFPTAYLLAILCLQCGASAIIAVISTSSSINAEVVNRTLDFQRIVTLSPRSILIGKMLGEPAMSYFLMIASIPLAAVCWGLGAASGAVIFWLYVNLATFTLMWAATGLINSLTPPTQTAGRQKSGGGGAGFVILFAVVPQLLIHGRNSLDTPGIGDVVQMLSPIGAFYHLWQDSAWNAHVAFWGVSLPSLLLAPVVQLAIVAWIIAAMSRRLKNPLDPLASKPRSYATLLVVDLAIAGICYSQWQKGFEAARLVYGYGLAHLVICLIMMFAATPRRATLISSIWRRATGASLFRERLTADRADMSIAAIVYGLIGVAVLAAGLALPMALTATTATSLMPAEDLATVALTTFVIVAALGVLHQLIVAATSRGGSLMFVLFVIFANLLPPVSAELLRASNLQATDSFADALASLSPVALYGMHMSRIASPPAGPGIALAAYACLGAISYLLLRRVLRRETATVQRKIASMALNT